MSFPQVRPDKSPEQLWKLQMDLLALAESELGSRDLSRSIHQPVFHANGPQLVNTPHLDGAFVRLSLNAKGYWPTAVYELAHETVHLLDPTCSYTNWLEEGIAVAFSIRAQQHYGLTVQRPNLASYDKALSLAESLPGGALHAGRAIRATLGPLNGVTAAQLRQVFPECGELAASQLASQCVPR
jgi:hypothetical protein